MSKYIVIPKPFDATQNTGKEEDVAGFINGLQPAVSGGIVPSLTGWQWNMSDNSVNAVIGGTSVNVPVNASYFMWDGTTLALVDATSFNATYEPYVPAVVVAS